MKAAATSGVTKPAAASGTATDKRIIGPFEASRFVQDDGSLQLNLAGGASPTVTIRIYRLPKV